MDGPSSRPVRLVVRDDALERSRLTVFFRALLAIPHVVWVVLWGMAAALAAFAAWLAALVNGQVPSSLHDFLAAYTRYSTHVSAYLFLASGPFPGFTGAPGYAVDVEIDPPARQRRWTAALRIVLALPALVLASALGGGGGTGWSSGASGWQVIAVGGGVAATAAFLVWFAALVRGAAPRGLRDLTVYAIGYATQVTGYVFLLTDRYPSSDPALVEPPARLPDHPVRIGVSEDLRRSRLTILFRFLLILPHVVWLLLWGVAVVVAAPFAWLAALALGRLPRPLHRFFAAFVRASAHLTAFATVVGGLFPPFDGKEGVYPVDVLIAPPERQGRWGIAFRFVLVVPAALVAGALGSVLTLVAVLGWVAALVTGRMPDGLRALGASCVRYLAQTWAYAWLVTARYPYAAPVLAAPAEDVQLALDLEASPAGPAPEPAA